MNDTSSPAGDLHENDGDREQRAEVPAPAGPAGFEWKSRGTWLGAPLVHIAIGTDEQGKLRVARGILAIGQRASGAFAIGIVATGFVSCGVVSLGLFSFGIVSIAVLAAAGVNAIAPLAFGITSFGYYAGGAAAFGWKIF